VLDNLSSCASYHLDSSLLARSSQAGEITQAYLFKNFRSLCLVSGKPDWAEIRIDLRGPGVCPEALYRYLVSFRNHQGIHEQCIERIFFDLQQLLSPAELSVAGLFTRRGGLDINPIRSTKKLSALMDMSTQWQRTSRQ
jgi:7-cyano-7-deazaguanine reductase